MNDTTTNEDDLRPQRGELPHDGRLYGRVPDVPDGTPESELLSQRLRLFYGLAGLLAEIAPGWADDPRHPVAVRKAVNALSPAEIEGHLRSLDTITQLEKQFGIGGLSKEQRQRLLGNIVPPDPVTN